MVPGGATGRRAAFLNWLLEQLALGDLAGAPVRGRSWRRIPHPDRTTAPGGPELDVVIDSDKAILFLEAKWRSKESKNQGVKKAKSQLQLRRDFLGKIGPRVYGERARVAVGTVRDEPLEEATPQAKLKVHTASIRWEELATYKKHPARAEFVRYLAWKERLTAR